MLVFFKGVLSLVVIYFSCFLWGVEFLFSLSCWVFILLVGIFIYSC